MTSNSSPSSSSVHEQLETLRASIDNIDAALICILAERFRCTQKVGTLKAHYGLPPSDPGREARQLERLRKLSQAAGLNPAFSERFFAFVVEEVIANHKRIAEHHEEQR